MKTPTETIQYRMLELGETIRNGDEFRYGGQWIPRKTEVGMEYLACHELTRRPIQPEPEAVPGECPPHYAGDVTPWDLQRCMQSSGSAFIDSRRTDAIEYCFRMKGDLLGDLKKARHCIDEAIKTLTERPQ